MIRGWLSAAAVAFVLAGTAGAAEVSVEGNRFYRDGAPWVAEGVTLVGLVSPEKRVQGKATYAAARAAFGPGMLGEVERYGADLVRFQVSQGALDPKSRRYDSHYHDEVLDAIALTRESGLNVIVSMQWHGLAGPSDSKGLPTGSTRRAWRELAAQLGDDRGILFEIFNEPLGNPRTPAEWVPWQESMQATIDALRDAGARNVLLVPGVQYSRTLDGAPPLEDPLGQLGYAVHPYLGKHNQTRAQWEKKFGDFARTHPVMATEFNAQAGGNYCRPELPEQTEALLTYLAEQRIGLVAWALDMPNLMNTDGSYTTLDDLVCGERRDGGRGGAGQMLHEHFLAN
jgi:hypothetical protein